MTLLYRGRGSHLSKSACSLRLSSAMCFFILLACSEVGADDSLPLSIAEAESLALRYEPGQSEYRARADALEEQSVAAGQLPDPVLRLGIGNFPIESGGFSTEGMTQAQLGIRQSFPPGKTRALSTQQFRSLSSEMDRRADARARDVLTSVRSAWLETYYWERAQAIVSDSRPYFEDLVAITRSLYAVGDKDRQDVLRAELELSRLEDRLFDIDHHRRAARAALSQWIGRDSARPVAGELPGWRQVPELTALQDEIARHPAVLAADARIDARETGVRLAEEQYKPGWAIDLAYGYRDGMLPNGNPRSDFVSLAVTVDLPVFRKNRQGRRFAAALSERRAANESREALLRGLSSRLEAEFARWQELSQRINLYDSRLLPQAEQRSSAALAAYRSEAGDFADVMRGVIDELDARLEIARLQTERAQSYAVLDNLGGFSR